MRPRSRSTRVAKSDWLYVVMGSSSIFRRFTRSLCPPADRGTGFNCLGGERNAVGLTSRCDEFVRDGVAIKKATRKSGEIWWPHGTHAGGQSPTLFTAGKNPRLRIAEGSKAVVLAPFSRLLSANGRRARRSARADERRRVARGEAFLQRFVDAGFLVSRGHTGTTAHRHCKFHPFKKVRNTGQFRGFRGY